MTEQRLSTDCRRLFARLSEYLDGELSPGICDELRAHLAGCAPCDAFFDTLRHTVELCRALPGRSLPDDLRAHLRALLAHAGDR